MRMLFLLFPFYLMAADSEPSTPIPTESPDLMIVDGVVEAIPETLTIVAECLGGNKVAATGQIISCITNDESPAHKIARGGILCCVGCCKKKHS